MRVSILRRGKIAAHASPPLLHGVARPAEFFLRQLRGKDPAEAAGPRQLDTDLVLLEGSLINLLGSGTRKTRRDTSVWRRVGTLQTKLDPSILPP